MHITQARVVSLFPLRTVQGSEFEPGSAWFELFFFCQSSNLGSTWIEPGLNLDRILVESGLNLDLNLSSNFRLNLDLRIWVQPRFESGINLN